MQLKKSKSIVKEGWLPHINLHPVSLVVKIVTVYSIPIHKYYELELTLVDGPDSLSVYTQLLGREYIDSGFLIGTIQSLWTQLCCDYIGDYEKASEDTKRTMYCVEEGFVGVIEGG